MRKHALLLLVALLAACAARAPLRAPSSTPAKPRPAEAGLRAELEAMYASDQRYRMRIQELAVRGDMSSPELLDLSSRQQAIDQTNLKRLKEILSTSGWPARSTVGETAAIAAFLIVQHADLATQEQCLPLLKDAVASGQARPEDLALLDDRVLMGEGRRQRYGSQLQPGANGGWEFYPIEDEKHVDERRKAVGLPPLAEYAKQFGIDYK